MVYFYTAGVVGGGVGTRVTWDLLCRSTRSSTFFQSVVPELKPYNRSSHSSTNFSGVAKCSKYLHETTVGCCSLLTLSIAQAGGGWCLCLSHLKIILHFPHNKEILKSFQLYAKLLGIKICWWNFFKVLNFGLISKVERVYYKILRISINHFKMIIYRPKIDKFYHIVCQ